MLQETQIAAYASYFTLKVSDKKLKKFVTKKVQFLIMQNANACKRSLNTNCNRLFTSGLPSQLNKILMYPQKNWGCVTETTNRREYLIALPETWRKLRNEKLR